ncbi:MAG: glycosyltransferase, partial [Bryobacteraceae bacterium]
MPRARVLYHLPTLQIGGTEKQLLNLIRRLDSTAFEAEVWCSGPWGPIGDRLFELGVAVYRFPFEPVEAAAVWLHRLEIDIFHSLRSSSASDVLAARLAGIPVVVTSRRNCPHWDRLGHVHDWE